jgi:hypothetical protein
MSEHKKMLTLQLIFTKKISLVIKLLAIVFAFCISIPFVHAERILDGDRLSGIKGIDDRVLVNGTLPIFIRRSRIKSITKFRR